MLKLCGITEAQMPRLFESYEAVGTLRPEIAAQLGLPETVTVCAGAGDNARGRRGHRHGGGGSLQTSAWAPRARCSSPATTSGWTPTTRCMPSPMRTDTTI